MFGTDLGKEGHTYHRSAAVFAGIDLSPGFKIVDEDGEDVNAAEAMWHIFDAFAEQATRPHTRSLPEAQRDIFSGQKLQAFFPVPDEMLQDIFPADWLFFDERDVTMARRFLWFSSAGSCLCTRRFWLVGNIPGVYLPIISLLY